jgi:SnoaL-like polyketide cyclase
MNALYPAPAGIERQAVQPTGPMKGFHAEFRDLDHYIRVITDRIWEGVRIDDIHLYYGDPCVVETALSVSTSIADVIAGTRATLAMFPDRRLLAEDVIQSGDAEGGYLSSHRIISPMTHRGDGSFGPATGRRVHARTIADCVCKDNRIIHEWLVRDHAAIALQTGTTPQALAQRWLDLRGGWSKPVAGPPPAFYRSHISTDPLAVRYAESLDALARRAGQVESMYDDAAQQTGPGESVCYGHADIAGFWGSVFESLQVQSLTIEHLALQRGGDRPDRAALRFRAKTVHSPINPGAVRYGKSSDRTVELLGILHAEFYRGRVIREWVLIDDVAVWMQVLAPAG